MKTTKERSPIEAEGSPAPFRFRWRQQQLRRQHTSSCEAHTNHHLHRLDLPLIHPRLTRRAAADDATMSSVVHYKFRSQREASRVVFDGTAISVWDLKREIIIRNKMGKGIDFDIGLYNAQTEEGG